MNYYKLKILNNKKWFILGFSILVIIILACYYFLIYQKDDEQTVIEDKVLINEEEKENEKGDFIVDIKGYVAHPGVYSFKESDNARINDLIVKAGGLLKDADTSTINLSKKIEDEMIIVIYSKSEIANFIKTQDDLQKKLEICELKIKNDACVKETSTVDNNKININEASVNELANLNGIGKSKAEAIVEYRKKTRFKSIEEIMNVDGIGENIFASIKENITV
jgi:competence protein ComEA